MKAIVKWFDNGEAGKPVERGSKRIEWFRILPFIALHLGCLAVFYVGVSTVALLTALMLYLIRMFAITGFYHRYFSHKAFKTSRIVQFIFAMIGTSATQRGPLWWAAHHREHHQHADGTEDPHSPNDGLLWSHLGWFLSDSYYRADYQRIKDFTQFPELRWLDRFDSVVPIVLALCLFISGSLLQHYLPELGTSGLQMLVWGYFISTVLLLHATLSINSLAHRYGKQRYQTGDNSRNNLLLALLTMGEGWHNNHHHYPVSARQGFFWWEVDITYYLLKGMQHLGLIWDLKTIPHEKRRQRVSYRGKVR